MGSGRRRAKRQGRRSLHVHSDATRGQEQTLFSVISNLMQFGMVVVGLPYSHQGEMAMTEIVGGAL